MFFGRAGIVLIQFLLHHFYLLLILQFFTVQLKAFLYAVTQLGVVRIYVLGHIHSPLLVDCLNLPHYLYLMGLGLLKLPFELTFGVALSHIWLFYILGIFVHIILKTIILRHKRLFFGAGLAGRWARAVICLGDAVGATAHLVDFLLGLRDNSIIAFGHSMQFFASFEFVVLLGRDPRHLIAVRSSFVVIVRLLGLDLFSETDA